MPKRALVDTNIILDAAMPERVEHLYALMLLDEVACGALDLCVAATSLKDIYYVLAKYSDEPSARHYVDCIMDAFEVLTADATICRTASFLDEPDFEGGVLRACAERTGVDFIISRDARAFQRSTVRRLSAHDYLDLFCDVHDSDASC